MGQVHRAAIGGELFGTSRMRMLRALGLVLIVAMVAIGAALSAGAWSGAEKQPRALAAPALTFGDDYGTRHHGQSIAAPLAFADDYGTRHFGAATVPILGPLDDHGTRHSPAGTQLSERDDYGTRH
jgi:hypothetical protein